MLKHLCLSKTLAALAVSLSVGLPAVTAEIAKPNILFILADDMGYGDCSVYNPESKVVTPNIDRLAKEGLLFTDAHSASATCTASRYGLLTGINPARRGVVNGICQLGPVLEEKEVTIAELLRDQGYVTRMVGKWHLGFEMKPSNPRPTYDFSKPFAGGPLDHGFDSFLGLRQAVSAAPYFYIRDREPEAIPTETTPGTKTSAKGEGKDPRTAYGAGEMAPGFIHEASNSQLCDEVVKSIRDHAAAGNDAKPLFLYYAMLEPHTPWLPTEQFGGMSEAGPYGDYLVQMDHEVGRVLEALEETGLEEKTLVVFSSDNGAMWPEADIQKWGHRANGPLAGGKARPEEGGHRVPFIARWPGHVPAGATTDATINHSDLLATLAELCEVELGAAAPEAVKDSHSFLTVLRAPAATHDRPAMSVTAGSFRESDWKLTFTRGSRSAGPGERALSNAALYDLAEDLGETQDLSESQPERKQQLFAAYQEYFADRKLKPLAEQVAAKKSQKKGSRPQPKTEANSKAPDPDKRMPAPSERIPDDAELSETQKASKKILAAEFHRKRAELTQRMDDLLSDEQKQGRNIALKKALEDGKKGVALRADVNAGADLTDQQRKQLAELRQEMGLLTRQHREMLEQLLGVPLKEVSAEALAETLPRLQNGKAPRTFDEMWAGFDPQTEPLDIEILKEWEEDGVVLRVLRYRIGVFKGEKAMMAAVYGFPKGGTNLPGLVQIHGGGQYADYKACLTNAKRGYATISLAWAGRISAPEYRVSPKEVQLFWDGKTDDPAYKITTDWGALDAYHAPSRNGKDAFATIRDGSEPWTFDDIESPRNSSWFLCTLGARRALTFLEQQPEVDGSRLGVYGHSMGGKLTVATAASDQRVKAGAPSCGGTSDRYSSNTLHPTTIGDAAALKHVECPIIFLSPANDFHGHINHLVEATNEIGDTEWRVTCSAHLNHRDYPENEVATQLWFDQHLKGSFTWPATPETAPQLKTEDGTPRLTVRPDASRKIVGVEVYYTQQGLVGKEHHPNRINQFWHAASCAKNEAADSVWNARLPVFSTENPLWVYANVIYALDAPVSGAGYYYGAYTTETFNVSSLIQLIEPKELQAAGVKATLVSSPIIETFEDDWEKEWFSYKPDEWSIRTHKVYHPIWAASEGASLSIDILAEEPNKLVLGIDEHAAEIELKGSPEWESVTLNVSDFKDAQNLPRENWSDLKELRLLAAEHLKSGKRGEETRRLVGANWKGAPPKFRNLRWVKSSSD